MLDHETAANSSSDEGSFNRKKKLPNLTQSGQGEFKHLDRVNFDYLYSRITMTRS